MTGQPDFGTIRIRRARPERVELKSLKLSSSSAIAASTTRT
jgi:NADPH-dependent 7-cyano-7-deazaguanine reductase QueF